MQVMKLHNTDMMLTHVEVRSDNPIANSMTETDKN